MITYEEIIKKLKKNAVLKSDEDFHRFTGFLEEGSKTVDAQINETTVNVKLSTEEKVIKCIDAVCENLVCNLGLGHLSDDISNIGLKFVLPISSDICLIIGSLGTTRRYAVSAGVARFFDSAENKSLLDDRISSLLPPTATKRFGCEKVQVVFDPILSGDNESIYVEIFACPYIIGS